MPPKSKKSEVNKTIVSQETCFVIMPFSGWFDNYYLNIYIPAIEEAGLTPKRADDIYRPSTIIQDIWDLTKNSKLVLADLTGKNANVFYELGLAHALAKPAILITESMDFVPFDLRALRVIEFDKNLPDWGINLKEKIKSSIKETLNSPLNAVLPTFLDIKEDMNQKGKITKQEKELIELKQDIELIKSNIKTGRVNSIQFSNMPFSARDIDIMKLIGSGKPYKEISYMFDIPMSRINQIVRKLYDMTGTNSTAQLIKYASDTGLI
jgi:DNA-binding CsgD family transcriptional regulator